VGIKPERRLRRAGESFTTGVEFRLWRRPTKGAAPFNGGMRTPTGRNRELHR